MKNWYHRHRATIDTAPAQNSVLSPSPSIAHFTLFKTIEVGEMGSGWYVETRPLVSRSSFLSISAMAQP